MVLCYSGLFGAAPVLTRDAVFAGLFPLFPDTRGSSSHIDIVCRLRGSAFFGLILAFNASDNFSGFAMARTVCTACSVGGALFVAGKSFCVQMSGFVGATSATAVAFSGDFDHG